MSLPALPSLADVQARLRVIFPESYEYFNWCTRDIAVKTVFASLYVGAIAGSGRLLAPKHVYKMSDEQAAEISDAARVDYATKAVKQGFLPAGKPWYADTSREPIRDETIRQGFIPVGAATEDKSIPTTSSKPRYALTADFAALFDPALDGVALSQAIATWQAAHLSKGALAGQRLALAGATRTAHGVLVRLPNGEVRKLTSGPSSIITKAVVEEFATRFLQDPVVIWISESGNKVVQQDDLTAGSIGLTIDPSRNLPDVILADVANRDTLLVFVEVVASDGPISEQRRKELLAYATDAGLDEEHVAFVTAYNFRDLAMRKTMPAVAWNSFIWLASEPENIIALVGTAPSLRAMLKRSSGKH